VHIEGGSWPKRGAVWRERTVGDPSWTQLRAIALGEGQHLATVHADAYDKRWTGTESDPDIARRDRQGPCSA